VSAGFLALAVLSIGLFIRHRYRQNKKGLDS
jgi:hypothetical protein